MSWPWRRQRRRKQWSRIASWLLIGPALEGGSYAQLVREGVTHVIDLRAEASDSEAFMAGLGLDWLHIGVHDRAAPSNSQLTQIAKWLDERSDPESAVYIHCEGGVERSPTIAIALLILKGKWLAEAEGLVMRSHPDAKPTPQQREWLERLVRPFRGDIH
ncbi:MAG TPA: dual specificity protein phosphatase [Candidatus Limnocylindria bacterium]|jgi:protein-tyrosine phosphatase|nr:dual specificity protein phosphatase [Candidatus Limnocylindria bacterium]